MASNNQNGGGPWGQRPGGGGGGGPWGPRPGGGGGGGGPQPPNVEEMLRRGQEKMKGMLPGGVGGKIPILIGLGVIIFLWLLTGFYRVDQAEEGVEMVFGKWTGTTTAPGLHWMVPWPIGEREVPLVTRLRRLEMGFQSSNANNRGGSSRDIREESLMLTSDQNIVDLDFVVLWKVKDAAQFVFALRDPELTVKAVAESAVREVVGQTALEPLLTSGRSEVALGTRTLMQEILDEYAIGVVIEAVELQDVKPPPDVAEAFEDVQRAQQDKEQRQNQAEAYRNQVVPVARGDASRMIEAANAYKEAVIKEAEGEAERFIAIYETYRDAKEVTRRRLYLDTMQDILGNAEVVIIDQSGEAGSQGVVPYLPLNELRSSRSGGQ